MQYKKTKFFQPTNWFVSHTTAAYFLTILLTLVGTIIFMNLPQERFPDVVLPKIYVTTVSAGNGPREIENAITRPLEKELIAISGAHVKNVTSNSAQDFSTIMVEFESDVPIQVARDKVKTAIDKARSELPDELTEEPSVTEVNFSDIPVMYIHLSGHQSSIIQKTYATQLKDKIERFEEISRVDIVGTPDQIVSIDVDKYKMQAAQVALIDIENAVKREHIDIGVGEVEANKKKRNIYIRGAFNQVKDIGQVVIQNMQGAPIYLRDIATISFTTSDPTNYARLNGVPTITLNILKKGGANLLKVSKRIHQLVEDEKKILPTGMALSITGDMSKQTKTSFDELVNAIIFGFLLVFFILMFFMGMGTAFFVALSVPLSVFITFLVLPLGNMIVGTDITLNFIVLFALLFGLGIIVDDAIVVIENTYRIFHTSKHLSVAAAAKLAAGEVFVPVLSGTLTTLAPFLPLLFWKGIVGKFMIYLPVILIFTLSASLIVAFLINPVFALSSIKRVAKQSSRWQFLRKPFFWLLLLLGVSLDMMALRVWGNLLLILGLFWVLYSVFLERMILGFQKTILPKIMFAYEKLLRFSLRGKRPVYFLWGMFLLFFLAVLLVWIRVPANKIFFFPRNTNPNKIMIYLTLPVGTNLSQTDSVTREVEKKVIGFFRPKEHLIDAIITSVAAGALDPNNEGDRSLHFNKSMLEISFVESVLRKEETAKYVDSLRGLLSFLREVEWSVEAEKIGPPTGAALNIEISGDDYETLATTADRLKKMLLTRVAGVATPRLDADFNVPEIELRIDREKANAQGLSTGFISSEIRTAMYGKAIAQYRGLTEDYPIILRFKKTHRKDIDEVLNTYTSYRANSGVPMNVPFSAFTHVVYGSSYGLIKRKNGQRTLTLAANVLSGYSAASVNREVAQLLKHFPLPQGVRIAQTGETQEQTDTNAFLTKALLASLLLMLAILIIQFNSLSKPIIVLTEILFSVIGVLLGFGMTLMDIPTIMVGVGIIGLSGIVIKNAILIIEFSDELRTRGYRIREAVVAAGKARIIPVMLTTVATVAGLVPLAIGMNIDFYELLRAFSPHIFFGGDSVLFWGPLSWTIIFGLLFSFMLTLVLVPAMYLIAFRLKRPMTQFYGTKWVALMGLVPPLFFILFFIVYICKSIKGRPLFITFSTPVSYRK